MHVRAGSSNPNHRGASGGVMSGLIAMISKKMPSPSRIKWLCVPIAGMLTARRKPNAQDILDVVNTLVESPTSND